MEIKELLTKKREEILRINLAQLVRVHQFDRLIPLFRDALKENGNG